MSWSGKLEAGSRKLHMPYTRRELAQLALTVLPAAGLLRPSAAVAARLQGRPNSKVAGVQLGLNVPYSFGTGRNMDADLLLENCLELGISGLELRAQPVERFMGAPAALINVRSAQDKDPAAFEALQKWRLSAPLDKAREFRRKYNEAGVLIEILKVDNIFRFSDPALDYSFELAKALGARAISTEIAEEGPKRLGEFADKHQMMVGYHGHHTTGPGDWEKLFAYARHNGANVDIGHFVAGNHGSPVPFLKQHHDRITHIHVKDRKANKGATVPFGEGETPIAEVLRLIRDNKWNIQATIEYEVPVTAGGNRMADLKKAVDFCRAALA
jgi:sugar phosphate isomerase/epimerase